MPCDGHEVTPAGHDVTEEGQVAVVHVRAVEGDDVMHLLFHRLTDSFDSEYLHVRNECMICTAQPGYADKASSPWVQCGMHRMSIFCSCASMWVDSPLIEQGAPNRHYLELLTPDVQLFTEIANHFRGVFFQVRGPGGKPSKNFTTENNESQSKK